MMNRKTPLTRERKIKILNNIKTGKVSVQKALVEDPDGPPPITDMIIRHNDEVFSMRTGKNLSKEEIQALKIK